VLVHMLRRNLFDWRPIGPRRESRHTVERLLSRLGRVRAYEEEVRDGVPLPMGPKLIFGSFWITRDVIHA
jgi:hypothetical protein